MNTRLIFLLSLFGLLMGVLTVSMLPSRMEFFVWIAIYIFSAYMIATKCKKKIFMHGLYTGILNNIWLSVIHLVFFQSYLSNHLAEFSLMADFPMPYSPRVMLVMATIPFGIFFGIILGVFAIAASAVLKGRR